VGFALYQHKSGVHGTIFWLCFGCALEFALQLDWTVTSHLLQPHVQVLSKESMQAVLAALVAASRGRAANVPTAAHLGAAGALQDYL